MPSDVPASSQPAADPAGPEDAVDLTVDQLAARVRLTVRNVRAYAARGLLPPPRLVGRTGYYGREHVARLLLVREMLAEGYTLTMIERALASAPSSAGSTSLALHRALLAPWLPASRSSPPRPSWPPVPVSQRTRAWSTSWWTSAWWSGSATAGCGCSPAAAGRRPAGVGLGIPPSALIPAQARVSLLVRVDRADLRRHVRRHRLGRRFVDGGAPPEDLDRLRGIVTRLQPAAAQALLASFRTEMAAAAQEALETALGALEGE